MMPFSVKKSKKTVRLFYATDIHGSERTYRKFVNAGKFYGVNTIVMGGDITGKFLIPIIQEGINGRHRATLQGRTEHLTTRTELADMQERLGTLGLYYKVMEEDEFEVLLADPAAVHALFNKLARQRLDSWVDLAETRLAGTGIKCFVTGGNDDDPEVLRAIHREATQAFFACEGKVAFIEDDYPMISLGFSTPTPWKTPREVGEDRLAEKIEEVVAQVPEMERCIFNFHDPPSNSTLDTCPELDWTTDPPTPIVKAGQIVMHGAGSKSVRGAVEKYQPMLGLHGHIHESQGAIKIGRTTCINPGSEYGEGILRGCLVAFENGRVEGYQMTSG
jgi:Icc-related predicted phosphoesterase